MTTSASTSVIYSAPHTPSGFERMERGKEKEGRGKKMKRGKGSGGRGKGKGNEGKHKHIFLPFCFRVLNAAARVSAHGNSTAACRRSVILSYTGSTSLSGSITSLALWYTDVSTENLRSTLRTSAHQSLILPLDSIYDQPVVISLSSHASD